MPWFACVTRLTVPKVVLLIEVSLKIIMSQKYFEFVSFVQQKCHKKVSNLEMDDSHMIDALCDKHRVVHGTPWHVDTRVPKFFQKLKF